MDDSRRETVGVEGDVVDDALLAETDPWAIPPCPNPLQRPFGSVGWLLARGFGFASLVLVLAVIAAIPLVNFYALGYLLEVEGRVARSGRLRDGFPMLGLAPRFGAIVAGFALFLLPVVLLNAAARDARIVDPASRETGSIEAVAGITTILVTVHLCLALARGGHFTAFLRPIKNVRWLWRRWRDGDYWDAAERHVSVFVSRLRIRELWWFGVRGFVVAFVWLAIPSALLAARTEHPGGAVVLALAGSLSLGIVLTWVPFLQARFAAERDMRFGFELGPVRGAWRRAPLCALLALFFACAMSLPLYLFKVAPLPRDALWLATTVFVLSIWPTRILTGWAYAKAMKRKTNAHWSWRWGCGLLTLPVVGAYLFLLYFTRYVVANGRFDQFLHHAFLLPSPF